jgi:sigma-E factor negative regulatory protein RseA
MAEQQQQQQQAARGQHEWLSALMDGEAEALAPGCAAWRDDPDARVHWHAYHLIGDVLRSEELASRPAADAAFLAALRGRLRQEPVVLAPAAAPGRRRGWMAPAAVAAGVAAVAGALVVTSGVWRADATLPQLASAPPAAAARVATPAPAPVAAADTGTLIRDARLDRYLNAHKQYGDSGALGLPGGVLQRATAVAPQAQAR